MPNAAFILILIYDFSSSFHFGSLTGTSDPFVVLTKIATEPGSKAEVIGKSEVIKVRYF